MSAPAAFIVSTCRDARFAYMPSALGSAGSWFQTWLSADEEEEAVQRAALKLHAKGLILDSKTRKRVRLKRTDDGQKYVPRYSLAKYALLRLVDGFEPREKSRVVRGGKTT